MASKYILNREQFLLGESVDNQPLYNFLNEVGVELMEMLDRVSPVLPQSVSDEFIETSQAYQKELDEIGFTDNVKLEHVLYVMGTSGITLFTESNFKIQPVIDQYYQINEGFVDTLRSIWNALTENGSPLGILHLILDIIGFIPFTYVGVPVDIVADAINAIIYLFEGQYGSALISAIAAALPGIGDIAKTLKLAKGFKSINKLAEVAFKTGKADAKLVKTLAKEDPSTFAKFIELFSAAKPVVAFFTKLLTGIGRGIEALLRTWPVSMLFGGMGKSLGKWLDEAAAPITKNLDNAISDMNSLVSKGSDDISAAIKSGDASKVADTGSELVRKTADELAAARAAGNVEEVNRLRRILQTRIEKGLPGAGQFVENGRLVDVVNKNLKISDEILKNPEKLDKFLVEGWDEYVKAWREVKQVDGVPVTDADLKLLDELKGLWIEGRKAEALFAGVKKLDDLPMDDLIRLTGDAAAVTTTKGANFSARLITELSDDPAKLSKFFNGILADPRTLAKLEEAGPNVVGLYRLFAKNPEVYVSIAKSGSAAIKRFEDLGKFGGKWSKAIRTNRLSRHRLILAKHIIGAPLRCPIAELGQGSMGGLDALSQAVSGGIKPAGVKESNKFKFILSRNEFLFEENEPKAAPIEVPVAPSVELKDEIEKAKVKKKGPAVLGPVSYVDICQSDVAKVIDSMAVTATLPPADSSLNTGGPNTHDYSGVLGNSAEIAQQKQVEESLAQAGIEAPLNDAGMMVEMPSNATIYEVVEHRIGIDYKYSGLWYMLGAIMTKDLSYKDIKSKLKRALSEYEENYKKTLGNKISTGEISFYPSPGEVSIIKMEMEKLDKDPSYEPKFFGPSVSSSDVLNMF